MDSSINEQKQFIKMTQTPVGRLIVSLAIPTIVSMLVTAIYNTGDTYFVAKLGTSAAGAVGIVFSLMAIIQAVGFTLGMGAGAQISRLLGMHDIEKATELTSTSFFSAIFLGLCITFFGIAFKIELVTFLGATKTILPYALQYVSYILYGAPIMCAVFVLNNILRAEGKARFAMLGIASGGLINLFLDPLFIFVFNLGIAGAAIATLLSQCISFIILISMFLRGKTTTVPSIKKISKSYITYFNIFKTGLPSLCRQGLASISTILLNNQAAAFDDTAVAAMSIVGKVFMLIFSIQIGFGQGFMPVMGYNYGARKIERVKKAFMFTLKTTSVMLLIISSICFIFAENIMELFVDDDINVIMTGILALRYQCIALPLLSLSVVCNMTFQTIGKSWAATFLSSARQGFFFIPLIIILPKLFGIFGIQIAQAVSDVLTFLCAIPFAVIFFKKTLKTTD